MLEGMCCQRNIHDTRDPNHDQCQECSKPVIFFRAPLQLVSPKHSAIKQETSHSPKPPDIPEEIG